MSDVIDDVVEQICAQGCRVVTRKMSILAAGKGLPETAGLTGHERQRVLRELEAIMRVYDGPCDGAAPPEGGGSSRVTTGPSRWSYTPET